MTVSKTRTHPLFSRLYVKFSEVSDKRGGAEHRRRLLDGLSGRVIEVGAGNGRNFAHYPKAVSEVLAVEPEPYLRKVAADCAEQASVPVQVVEGLADELPVADESFDAAVVSLVLCSVPDQQRALAEIRRVLRPGGELRFYEHVVSNRPTFARLQSFADATFWPLVAGGCHCARDTDNAIRRAGFEIGEHDRFPFRPARFQPPVPHILGTAVRP